MNEETRFNFGANLREVRKRKKMTQKEVGAAMGITEQGYARFERLRYAPRESTVIRIAAALGVSSEVLHGGFISFDSGVDLMMHFRRMSDGGGRDAVLNNFHPDELLAAAIDGYLSSEYNYQMGGDLAKVLLSTYNLTPAGRQKAAELLDLLNMIPVYQRKD